MALWECQKCSTLCAVGVDVCPHCGAKDLLEFGADGKPKPKAKPKAGS